MHGNKIPDSELWSCRGGRELGMEGNPGHFDDVGDFIFLTRDDRYIYVSTHILILKITEDLTVSK